MQLVELLLDSALLAERLQKLAEYVVTAFAAGVLVKITDFREFIFENLARVGTALAEQQL